MSKGPVPFVNIGKRAKGKHLLLNSIYRPQFSTVVPHAIQCTFQTLSSVVLIICVLVGYKNALNNSAGQQRIYLYNHHQMPNTQFFSSYSLDLLCRFIEKLSVTLSLYCMVDKTWTDNHKFNPVRVLCITEHTTEWTLFHIYWEQLRSTLSVWYDKYIYILWADFFASELYVLILPVLIDLLYKDYNFDQKFSLSTSSSSGLVRQLTPVVLAPSRNPFNLFF